MSTRAIRAMLEDLEAGNIPTPSERLQVKAKLDAIEKAAKEAEKAQYAEDVDPSVFVLLSAIARDAQ